MPELKPCPFCGRYPKIEYGGHETLWQIFHPFESDEDECPIATYADESLGAWMYDTKEEAVDAWNRRANE